MSSIPDPAVTDWVPMGLMLDPATSPSVRVYRSTVQSIPSGAFTAISFDTVRYDTFAATSPQWAVGSPTRLTCKIAGTYTITGQFTWSSGGGGSNRLIAIQVNGQMMASNGASSATVAAGPTPRVSVTAQVKMAVGDYAEMFMYQDSGAALGNYAGGTAAIGEYCEFMMALGGGAQGPAGVGVPTPVVNGQWIKGSGGVAVWSPIAAADLPPQAVPGYGTTFPASPSDGQEYVLVDSVTAPSWIWRFRYNVSSTSAYKWEFIGGGMKYATGYLGTWQQFSGSANWVPGAPSFAVGNRAGDYSVTVAAQFYSTTASTLIQFGAGPDAGAMNPVSTYAPTGTQTIGLAQVTQATVGVGGTIFSWYWANNATTYVANTGMLILPVRVQ